MKIALLFPGYGSQYVGMGKDLYDEYRIVQEYFEEASNCSMINFVKLCFASSDSELSKLSNAYTSLFLVGCSVYAILKELAIEPALVAGYNNGEYTALFAASCFSLPDGLYLLNKFCSFYQPFIDESDVDALQIIGYEKAELEKLCKKASTKESKVYIAIENSEKNHIVAGHKSALEQMQSLFDANITIESIGPEAGLHSVLMDTVIQAFKNYLEKVDFKDLKIPFLSSIDGMVVTQGEEIKKRFIDAFNSTLYFSHVVKQLHDYDCIIVSAPSQDLVNLIRESYKDKLIVSIDRKADVEKLKEILKTEQEKITQDI